MDGVLLRRGRWQSRFVGYVAPTLSQWLRKYKVINVHCLSLSLTFLLWAQVGRHSILDMGMGGMGLGCSVDESSKSDSTCAGRSTPIMVSIIVFVASTVHLSSTSKCVISHSIWHMAVTTRRSSSNIDS